MNYIFKSVSYAQNFPLHTPIITAEVEIRAENNKEWRDVHKLINAKTYEELKSAENILGFGLPNVKNVYFNKPVTVVLWDDGTKTVVRCQDSDTYSKETGLALCMAKKALGNTGKFNDIFHKWIPEEKKPEPQKKCSSCKHACKRGIK